MDKKYFEDLNPSLFTEQDWQDIFDLLDRNPEKFRAMFKSEEAATAAEQTIKKFLRDIEIDKSMRELDEAGAPEHVKDFWLGMAYAADKEEERKAYTPDAERMDEIDMFENMLHAAFDMQVEYKIQKGDENNPFSEQYLGPEYKPPIFKRRRKYGTNWETITLSFDAESVAIDLMDFRNYDGILPEFTSVSYNGVLNLNFSFINAYNTETESQN